MTVPLSDVVTMLPATPAGTQAAWVLERMRAVAEGEAIPGQGELEEHYSPDWLEEVSVRGTYARVAPLIASTRGARVEAGRPDEARIVFDLADGSSFRFRCVVAKHDPHPVVLQSFTPALPAGSYIDRIIDPDGRRVSVRDFGGVGPLLLLWHGSGCDVTIWEAMVPYLKSFRVVAQDLPGHGGSTRDRLSVHDAIADADVVLANLGCHEPIIVGGSLGGWAALHYAATRSCRALVCLDGPANLDYAEMGIQPGHPGFIVDAPDVPADFGALRCPAMVVLCRGRSPEESAWMVPFRQGLADYLATTHPDVRVEWVTTGHMLGLLEPALTAELIDQFSREVGAFA